ncbi:MAG: hypothetical protein ACYTG2_06830 [Planctomycetota bacterium]
MKRSATVTRCLGRAALVLCCTFLVTGALRAAPVGEAGRSDCTGTVLIGDSEYCEQDLLLVTLEAHAAHAFGVQTWGEPAEGWVYSRVTLVYYAPDLRPVELLGIGIIMETTGDPKLAISGFVVV